MKKSSLKKWILAIAFGSFMASCEKDDFCTQNPVTPRLVLRFYDINDRTKFDASISSGLVIMANQKHLYMPEKKESKLIINFAKYKNEGITSQLIK